MDHACSMTLHGLLGSLLDVTDSIVLCRTRPSSSLGSSMPVPLPSILILLLLLHISAEVGGDAFVSISFSGWDFDGAELELAGTHVAGAAVAAILGASLYISSELLLLWLLALLLLLLQLLLALAAFFSSSFCSVFIVAPVEGGGDPCVAGATALLETSLGMGSESFPLDGALITALLGVSG